MNLYYLMSMSKCKIDKIRVTILTKTQ
jgi:hypothetical protein